MKPISPVRLLVALAALVVLPVQAAAQLSLEADAGLAIPAGDLATLAKAGGTFGAGLAVRVHPHASLRVDASASLMEGKGLDSGREAPGVNIYRVAGGVELDVLRLGSLLLLSANAGAGLTAWEVETFVAPESGRTESISESGFSLSGGAALSQRLSRGTDLVLRGEVRHTLADAEDSASLERLGGGARAIDSLWSIPLTLGLRIRL